MYQVTRNFKIEYEKRKIMNISAYINEYLRIKRYKGICKEEMAHNLIDGDASYSFKKQKDYANSNLLAYNIEQSVKGYTRDKDVAITIYKNLCAFLCGKGVDVKVNFPIP